MKDDIEVGGLYKVKDSKKISDLEEMLTSYVKILGFIANPLEKDNWYIEFVYLYEDNLEPVSKIKPIKVLSYNSFFDYFDLRMTAKEVNQRISNLKKVN